MSFQLPEQTLAWHDPQAVSRASAELQALIGQNSRLGLDPIVARYSLPL